MVEVRVRVRVRVRVLFIFETLLKNSLLFKTRIYKYHGLKAKLNLQFKGSIYEIYFTFLTKSRSFFEPEI